MSVIALFNNGDGCLVDYKITKKINKLLHMSSNYKFTRIKEHIFMTKTKQSKCINLKIFIQKVINHLKEVN